MKKLLYAVFVAMACTACSKENENVSTTPQAVRFTTSIATKATGAKWAQRDSIGIRMFDGSNNTVNGYTNRLYTTDTLGVLTSAAEDMYYPLDGSNVGFSAYYPYLPNLTDTYTVDVTNQSVPTKIDLLYAHSAVSYNKRTAMVPLTFNHSLSKFVIKTHAGVGISSLAGMQVTIQGMNTSAPFHLTDGTFGTPTQVAPLPTRTITDGEQYEAIVIPAATLSAITVEFTLSGELFTWHAPALTFEAGKAHEWEVTVTRTGVSGIQGSIIPWTNGTGGSGSAL